MWSIAFESLFRARRSARVTHLAGAVALSMAIASPARAEPRTDTGVAAQVLFYEGRELMKAGRYTIACLKLEQSLALEYSVGTELHLADCNERLGRLSRAWAGFVNVTVASRTQDQRTRALERARALEPRVPKLVIDVPSDAPSQIDVLRDGESVSPSVWGQPVPVDPGVHSITASTDGRTPWRSEVTVSEGATVRVSLPRGSNFGTAPAPPPETKKTTSALAEGNAVLEARPKTIDVLSDPVRAVNDRPDRPVPWRTLGWIGAGVGLAGVGIGVGFGVDSYGKQQSAKNHCDGERCDSRGLALRASAMRSGDVATIATGAGALMLAAGVVTLLVTGGGPARSPQPRRALQATPLIAANGGGLSLQGVLP